MTLGRILPWYVIVLLAAALAGTTGAGDATMRAAVVSSGRIQIRDVARPVAGPGQVLVKIRYAGVNPGDWKAAAGSSDDAATADRLTAGAGSGNTDASASPIPGVDGAGVIAAVGGGVAG